MNAIVVNFQCGEIVKPDRIASAVTVMQDGCQLAIDQAKPLQFDLGCVLTLSAAAIGRFVQVGRQALDAGLDVQFLIPPELDGMFRILHLHNLFDIRVFEASEDEEPEEEHSEFLAADRGQLEDVMSPEESGILGRD